jgi:hypothetical protein
MLKKWLLEHKQGREEGERKERGESEEIERRGERRERSFSELCHLAESDTSPNK